MTRLFDKVTKDTMERLYETEKRSISEIADILRCGYGSVHRLLDHYSIKKRSRKEGAAVYFSKNLGFNIDFFRRDSPAFYYVLGLLASDGCVRGNAVTFTSTDKDVIDWIVKEIEYSNKVSVYLPKNGTKEAYNINLASPELVSILSQYGIVNNKSLTMNFPKNINQKYLPHYIRGVFDGDGSISLSTRKDNGAKTHALSIVSGSERFIAGLCKAVESSIGLKKFPQFHRDCYYFRISSRKEILLFCNWIYKDGMYGMERKVSKFNVIREGGASA